nr:unnamed protein product [Callosobruchus analis]
MQNLTVNHPYLVTSRSNILRLSRQVHECKNCHYKSAYNRDLKRHISRVHPDAISESISCKYCKAMFKSDRLLESHIARAHLDAIAKISTQFECGNCTFKCFIKTDLESHMVKNHARKGTVKMYSCLECPFKTGIKGYLEKHVLGHRGVDSTISTCTQCKAPFMNEQIMGEHVIKDHPNFIASISCKIYECVYCAYKTTFPRKFACHDKICQRSQHSAVHNNIVYKVRKCKYCDAKFNCKPSLLGHILKQHPEVIEAGFYKVHECKNCHYKSAYNRDLKRHISRVHPDAISESISCKYCKATFKSDRLLESHIARAHLDAIAKISTQFECANCTFKCFIKIDLESHMVKNHARKGTFKMYSCLECPFKTGIKGYLEKHVLGHCGVDSTISTCTQCKAPFMNEQIMGEHVIKDHPNFIASISCKIYDAAKKKSSGSGKAHRESFICYNCNYADHCKEGLIEHMAAGNCQINSSPHKPIKYDCKQCHKIYTRKITFDDHIVKKHPEHIALVSSDVLECRRCDYKTTYKRYLHKHKLKHPSVNKCAHCKAVYMSKKLLDAHILSKHPEFVTSVSSKILKCTSCDYKTTHEAYLSKHKKCMHSAEALPTCPHCNTKFKTKTSLFNHIVQNHPSFASSVTSKVYECSKCSYKTTRRYLLDRHLLNHADVTSKFQLSKCERCNVTFKGKQLRDAHILKEHPNFIGSVTSRIHECTNCNYKTTFKFNLKKHMLKHCSSRNLTCSQCDASFRSKTMLDNHVSQRHTNLATPSEETTHECSQCQYKTEAKSDFDEHMLTHSNVASDLNPCEHCDMSFKHKAALYNHVIKRHPETTDSIPGKILECSSCTYKTTRKSMDDHVLRKHPDLIATVTSKLHTCKYCTYKTTLQTNLAKHVADHTEIFGKLFPCAHCVSSFKTKQSLDNHILKKHADFNSSVSCTVYQCDKCPYITAFRHCLTNHNCRNV